MNTYATKEERQIAETNRMARFSRLFSFVRDPDFVNDRPIKNPDGTIVPGPYDHLMATGLTYAQAKRANAH